MAKRFTDTEKWKDEWFYGLSPEMKLAWIYILDCCDHCGIWKRNFELLRNSCGTVTKQLEAEKVFEGRFFVLPNGDWFIPKFLKFQYSKGIGGKMPAIISVRKKIIALGLLEYISKQFGNSFVTVKDKDKDINTLLENNKKGEVEIFSPLMAEFGFIPASEAKDRFLTKPEYEEARETICSIRYMPKELLPVWVDRFNVVVKSQAKKQTMEDWLNYFGHWMNRHYDPSVTITGKQDKMVY